MPRFVSLVPSATETLRSLGADVIACTRFCEQPDLRHVGGTKNPDIAAIVELGPDVVVVDEEENRHEDASALAAAGLELLVTSVRDVAGAFDAVDRLAARAGVAAPERPAAACAAGASASAFVPIWRRPWMTINGDTYGASVLALAGVELVTAAAADRYPTVELDALAGLAPDLVLVPSEPYAFGDEHLDELADAFPSASVRRVDGQDLFWWGTRTAGALTRIASAVATRG